MGQDYPNLEIIISDDCSQDDTAGIIESFLNAYKGTQTIVYNRNEKNLGLIPHLNKVLSMTHGDYIVLAAGDDVSLPNRTMLSYQKIKESGTCSLALNFRYIDGNGNDLGEYGFEVSKELSLFRLNDYIKGDQSRPAGPSRIISRKLLDVFGPFKDDCPTEDTTTTLRALLLGGVAYYGEVGVLYRWHGDNISTPHNLYTNINPRKIYHQYYKDLCVAKNEKKISCQDYYLLKKIIDDYKATQIFVRRLYIQTTPFNRYCIVLAYLLNPKVLPSHKTKSYLRDKCNDVFVFWDKIRRMICR